jgi:prevent-host-death family protein
MTMSIADHESRIPAGQFKARCLALIDEVGRTRQAVTITKRGKPVARLVPLAEETQAKAFGFLSGHVIEEGDIVSPIGERWEADGG